MAQSSEPRRFNGGPKSAHGEWTPVHRLLRVLLAEDNKINQQFATLVLNRAGHSVEVAANGNLIQWTPKTRLLRHRCQRQWPSMVRPPGLRCCYCGP